MTERPSFEQYLYSQTIAALRLHAHKARERSGSLRNGKMFDNLADEFEAELKALDRKPPEEAEPAPCEPDPDPIAGGGGEGVRIEEAAE